MKIPLDTKTLVEKLNAEFPHRCPQLTMSERDIWAYAGKRALVDYLLAWAEDSRLRVDLNNTHPEQEGDD